MITTLDIGGAERLMVDLLPLLNTGDNVVELLLFNGLKTPFKDKLIRNGIEIHQLSCWKGIKNHYEVYNPINIIKLKKFLKSYDIIHTHNTACQLYVPLAALLSSLDVKFVTTEHSTFNRRRSKKWLKPIDRWMYNQYSAIICISEQASTNLKNYIGQAQKIHTIMNGVKVDSFFRPITDISGKKNFVISMIAAFRKEKDHETLLKAMARLPINYVLQLAGRDFDGKVPQLKQMCAELGIENRVVFMGPRTDIPDILENSDVAVLSSYWEGFGLSAVEAMAAGKPLIASNVGGLRDVVQRAGVLFSQGDDVELANRIKWLCENPNEYKAVAEMCQKRAHQYDISIMAGKYLQLYNTVLS